MRLTNKIVETYRNLSTKVKLAVTATVIAGLASIGGAACYHIGQNRGFERGLDKGHSLGYYSGEAHGKAMIFSLVPGSEEKYRNDMKELSEKGLSRWVCLSPEEIESIQGQPAPDINEDVLELEIR